MRAYLDTNVLLVDAFHARVPSIEATTLCTSVITMVELGRVLRRHDPHSDMWRSGHSLLENVDVIDVSTSIAMLASNLPLPYLKTMDALHLASALITRADVVVTKDRQLQRACTELGLHTA